MKGQSVLLRFSKWLFLACGIWLIGLGGFMAGCGVLIAFAGMRAVPQCLQGTGAALAYAGLLTVAAISWTNFVLDSEFKWLLLAPAIAWFLALVSYALAAERSTPSFQPQRSE